MIGVGVRGGPGRVESSKWRTEGPGISPEHRAQIMARSFRPDTGAGARAGGFGLGLALTKAYMCLLGGTVGCEPERGRERLPADVAGGAGAGRAALTEM